MGEIKIAGPAGKIIVVERHIKEVELQLAAEESHVEAAAAAAAVAENEAAEAGPYTRPRF